MQDRYTGDIGDFGKYGLLRSLVSTRDPFDGPRLSLGIVWYLVPDEEGNADGSHIKYLENSDRLRCCDPDLFDALYKIVKTGARRVRSIRENKILRTDTVFYETPLAFDGMASIGQKARDARENRREDWLQGASEATANCDVVFLDPDNGLECRTKSHHSHGPKYVFFDEVIPFVRRGQSLVIYQHMIRRNSLEDQIQIRFSQIKERLGEPEGLFAMVWHTISVRIFFIIPSEPRVDVLLDRANRFLKGAWSEHFELAFPREMDSIDGEEELPN